jgi:hypothetical protein
MITCTPTAVATTTACPERRRYEGDTRENQGDSHGHDHGLP